MSKLHRPSSKTCFGSVPEYPKVPKLHRPSYKLLFRIRFKRLESEQMAPQHACETIFWAPEVVRLRRQRIENYGSVATSRRRLRRKKKAAGEHHSKTGPESGRTTYEHKLPNPPFLMTISRKSVPFSSPPPILRQKLRVFRTFPKIRDVFRADFRGVFRGNFRGVFRGGFRGWFSGGRLARYPKLRDLSKKLGNNSLTRLLR